VWTALGLPTPNFVRTPNPFFPEKVQAQRDVCNSDEVSAQIVTVGRDIPTGEWTCHTLLDLFDLNLSLGPYDLFRRFGQFHERLSYTLSNHNASFTTAHEKDRENALGYATAFLLRTMPIVSMTIVSTQNINDISLSAFGHVRDVSGRMSKVQILQGTLTSKCRSLVTWPTKTPAGIHLNIALPPRDTARVL
jgi:hypothetical protein